MKRPAASVPEPVKLSQSSLMLFNNLESMDSLDVSFDYSPIVGPEENDSEINSEVFASLTDYILPDFAFAN